MTSPSNNVFDLVNYALNANINSSTDSVNTTSVNNTAKIQTSVTGLVKDMVKYYAINNNSNATLQVKQSLFTVQIYSLIDYYNLSSSYATSNNLTQINLTNCIKKIESKYSLSDNELRVKIITWAAGVDSYKNSSGSANFSILNVKDPKNITEYNLTTECSGVAVLVSSPTSVNISTINLKVVDQYKSIGIDLLDTSDPFFNDKCIPYYDLNGNYLTLKQRQELLPNYTDFCSFGCVFMGFDSNNYTICKCYNISGGFSSLTKTFSSTLLNSNIFTFTCYKTAFSVYGFFANAGNWVLMILVVLCIFFLVLFYRINLTLIDNHFMELIRIDAHLGRNEKVTLEEFVEKYNILPSAKLVISKEGKPVVEKVHISELKGSEKVLKKPELMKKFKSLLKKRQAEEIESSKNIEIHSNIVPNYNSNINIINYDSNSKRENEMKKIEEDRKVQFDECSKKSNEEMMKNYDDMDEFNIKKMKINMKKSLVLNKKQKTLAFPTGKNHILEDLENSISYEKGIIYVNKR